MDRASVITQMYEDYLDAHDQLVAGTRPRDIPALASFSARMDDDTVFRFPSLGLELRGSDAVDQLMVDLRRDLGLRETSEHVVEHGNVVVSFNRTTTTGSDAGTGSPVVAVFQFDEERISGFWGFAG